MTTYSDGVVTLRPPQPRDEPALVAIDDEQYRRFMGEPSGTLNATFSIVVDGEVVGWIDFDRDHRDWLDHSQVNLGYAIQQRHRRRGYATRALLLMVRHLEATTDVETATLLISEDNEASLRLPGRCGFVDAGTIDGERFFVRRLSR